MIGPTLVTRYPQIIVVAQCIMFPGNMTRSTSSHAFVAQFWSEHYIRQIKYIFCAAFVDLVSLDVTVASSLKRFNKLFSFLFYLL